MFHLTHMYSIGKAGSSNPYALFGSTLLDLPLVNSRYLKWEDFKHKIDWFDKIKNSDLKKGLLSHVAVDYISEGELNQKMTDGTGRSFEWFKRFPKLRSRSVLEISSHNAPEWFLELYVAKESNAFALFKYAVQNVDINNVSEDLAQAFGTDTKIMTDAIKRFLFLMKFVNIFTKTFSPLANPEQGRKETLQDCIDACRKII